ncbi:MAG: hypothetical protein RSD06_01430, partial [Bacilli bacterium]
MYSEEHKLYLNKIRKSNKLVKFTQLFIVLFFIMIWQLSANYNVINTFILSSPKMIFECLIN